jgi:hypothetical protein
MRAWLRILKNKYHWFNKIRVSKSSVFICKGDLFKTHILIHGSNSIIIGENTHIAKIEMKIAGEGNRLTIGHNCYIENDLEAKPAPFED